MNDRQLDAIDNTTFDVVICGGGLSGLTLGRQLRREHPSLSVLLVEKTARPLPPGCHKVGESSVELGSNYLERLGLRDYLLENQLIKHGLRFFPGGGQRPLEERLEVGPMQEPVVPSYQLDRGTLESDLRGFLEDDGVVLVEGCMVRDVDLRPGEEPHGLTIERSGDAPRKVQVKARWLVDATGRHALLRKRLKLTRGSPHVASAGWYRVEGRVDITSFVPDHARTWHDAPFAKDRWRSTNHLMGPGYWAWIIPLSSGMTSIGVVIHEELHSFDDVRSLERCQEFLRKHEPVMAKHLEGHKVLDFLCLRGYSHTIGRGWSTDRWALVGEAGAFVDPLYSPGTDFIAYANSFTSELIRIDREGGDLATRCTELNLQYRALVAGNIDVYARSAPVYGHPGAMLAKVYWDNFAYWSYSCQYFMRGIYKLSGAEAQPFLDLGRRIVELSSYVQTLLREWALLAPEEPQPGFSPMPRFPSVLVEAHLALRDEMTPAQTLTYMRHRIAQGEEITAEFLVRVLSLLGDARAAALMDRTKAANWQLRVPRARLAVEPRVGLSRRHALPPLARDVERSLGRVEAKTGDATLVTLLSPLLEPAAEQASSAGA